MPNVVKSPRAPLNVPVVDVFTFLFGKHLGAYSDKVATVDGLTGESLTFGQIKNNVLLLASGLSKLGVGKGDTVGLFAPNNIEYGIVLVALARLGAHATPANPTYTVDELNFQLVDTGAKLLITVTDLLPVANKAAEGTKVQETFVLGKIGSHKHRTVQSLYNLEPPPPVPAFDPKTHEFVISYSSGTTGRPKGTQLTHYNIVSNLLQFEDFEFTANGLDASKDVSIGVLPFYHIYGLTLILLASYYFRSTVVAMAKFDLIQWVENVQKYKVTIGFLVPPIVIGLLKSGVATKYDLSSIRIAVSGAAPLGPEIEGAWKTTPGLKHITLKQAYGMTELSPLSHVTPTSKIKIGSIGQLLANCEARVINPETDKDVPAGHEGELLMRGPNVMKGYLNNPKATNDTFLDGWLRTGDIVKVDEEGYFFVTDRLKELIKFKGLQVAPAELEGILLSHPHVQDSAVIPQNDEAAGEVPKAYVVLKPEVPATKATADAIASFVESKVAPHKKLRGGIEFIGVIPKSASGKILRRILKSQNEERIKAKL